MFLFVFGAQLLCDYFIHFILIIVIKIEEFLMPDFSFSTRFSRTMLIDLILFFLFIPSVDLLDTNALCFMLTAKEMCASENRGISIEARKRKTK